jgi:hypothetical protein
MRAAAKRIVLAAVLVAWPIASRAQEQVSAGSPNTIGPCRQLGVNVWGVSYHVNRATDYDERNWGAGLTCYGRPDLKWLGRDENNRLFRRRRATSWRPRLSAVARRGPRPGFNPCRLSFIGALTVATSAADGACPKCGPLPGFALGCDHLRTNVILVPSPSKPPLAAVVASMSVLF